MNAKKEERFSRLLPPSTLRKTTLSTKENLPTAVRVPARRITYLSKPVTPGKVNTAPKNRTCTTVHKNTQVNFKSNPASLEEILSSKTANDADKKRSETLVGGGLRPKSTAGAANRTTDLSRARMTYSYRVKKPCDSRMPIYTGALRVTRTNTVRKEPRKSMIASKALSTIRELRVPPKREPLVNKHRQSFAARRQPSSIARRITTSYANKGTSVLGSIKANRLTMLPNLSTLNHQSTIQNKNSEITSDSLLEPMKNLKFDALEDQQKCEGDKKTSNGNHIPTVAEFRLFKELETSNHQSTIQKKNSEITSDSLLEPMKNLKFDALDNQQKCEGDKETSNESHIPTVAEFRLFEELEKLEKQLEQEISEDLSDI